MNDGLVLRILFLNVKIVIYFQDIGSVNLISAPGDDLLASAQILPPWARTHALAIASPIPEPLFECLP